MVSVKKLIEERMIKRMKEDPTTQLNYVCLDTGNCFCTCDLVAVYSPYTGTKNIVAKGEFDQDSTIPGPSAGVDLDNVSELGGETDDVYFKEDDTSFLAMTPIPGTQANPFVQKPTELNPADSDPYFMQTKPLMDNPADDDEEDLGDDTADPSDGFVDPPPTASSIVPPYAEMSPGIRT